jgi:WD40 repeat protein
MYFGVPIASGIAVYPTIPDTQDSAIKIENMAPIVLPHSKPVSDFTFSRMKHLPFNHLLATAGNILASGSRTDGMVRIWKLPKDLQSQPLINRPQREIEPAVYLSADESDKKIEVLKFHPTVGSVLLSSSIDSTIKLWNIEEMTEIITMMCPDNATASSVSFDYCGDSFVSTTSDGKL